MTLTLVVLAVVAAANRLPLPDVAWQLYLADRLMGAPTPLPHYIEVNPPLFVWLSVPAAFAARFLPLTSWQCLVILAGLTTAVGVDLAYRILAAVPGAQRLGAPAVSALAFACGATIATGAEFGQREHLALVVTTPYILLAAARVAGFVPPEGLARVVGLLGAIGWLLKPYFLLPLAAVEAGVARQCGWRSVQRTESRMVALLGVAYVAVVALSDPEYFRLMAGLRRVYGDYIDAGPLYALVMSTQLWLPMVALIAFLASRRAHGRRSPVRDLTVSAMLGYWLVVSVQGKGFPYHFVPVIGLSLLAIAEAALGRRSGGTGQRLLAALALVTAVGLGVQAWQLAASARSRSLPVHAPTRWNELVSLVREESHGQPVAVLSSNIASGWPLAAAAGSGWGLRYPSLWILAGLYDDALWTGSGVPSFTPFSARSGQERAFHEEVLQDLEVTRPAVIVVLRLDRNRRGFGGATRLDYLRYFMEDPRFQRLFSGYAHAATLGEYAVYRRLRANSPVEMSPANSQEVYDRNQEVKRRDVGFPIVHPDPQR